MAGAILRLLQNGSDIQSLDGGGNLLGLMTHDGNNFFGSQWHTGADDVINERASAGAVENLRETGFEASSFAGGEDENSDVFIGHKQSIVPLTEEFDNLPG